MMSVFCGIQQISDKKRAKRRAPFHTAVLLLGLVLSLGRTVLAEEEASSLFDQEHLSWSALLSECVVTMRDGLATAADYQCFDERSEQLQLYLNSLSAVSRASFQQFTKAERLAFLINAYNAWTIELILTEWPKLESIKDLGSLFRSPWKREFIPLFGETISLDDVEHGMIRAKGDYDDPRIHFAVNCASIGCPALLETAYVGATLEQQLEAQTARFLRDRTRNRLEAGELELSPLFKWYRQDFEAGWRGSSSLGKFLVRYRGALALEDADVAKLEAGALEIGYLSYDWDLNRPPTSSASR